MASSSINALVCLSVRPPLLLELYLLKLSLKFHEIYVNIRLVVWNNILLFSILFFKVTQANKPSETGQISGFRAFAVEHIKGMAWNWIRWDVFWTLSKLIKFWSWSAEFHDLGDILTKWKRSQLWFLDNIWFTDFHRIQRNFEFLSENNSIECHGAFSSAHITYTLMFPFLSFRAECWVGTSGNQNL